MSLVYSDDISEDIANVSTLLDLLFAVSDRWEAIEFTTPTNYAIDWFSQSLPYSLRSKLLLHNDLHDQRDWDTLRRTYTRVLSTIERHEGEGDQREDAPAADDHRVNSSRGRGRRGRGRAS